MRIVDSYSSLPLYRGYLNLILGDVNYILYLNIFKRILPNVIGRKTYFHNLLLR